MALKAIEGQCVQGSGHGEDCNPTVTPACLQTWLLAQSARGLKSTPKAVPADPSMMTSGMQMQVVPYLFNIGLMTLVQTLYVGFVLVKLPFSLTARFRSVTQRDVVQAIDLLDPSLVTSFSWYLMCMYGCHGIITLVLGGKSSEFADQSAMMMSQMGMGGGKQQQWNASAAYKQERQQLRIVSPGPKALLASERAIVEAQQSGDDVETVAARQAAAEAESRKQRLSAGG